MIQLVADEPDKVRQYAASTVREADRLNRLANELLDYSRGEIRLDVRVVPLDHLFGLVEESMRERLSARGVTFTMNNGVTRPVLLDEERMGRVLINLCDNARKAMTRGDTLTMTATIEGSEVVITVRDTGRGMSEDIVRHIFEPFYSSSPDGGTGLGMVIVKNVVEAHRGSITVESTPEVGTEIALRLPAKI